MPHFTERCRPGSVLAARASTRSAIPRCGCGRLAMYAKTGLSPTAAFAGLALPVAMDSGRVVAGLSFAAVRLAGSRPASMEVLSVLTGMAVTCFEDVCRPDRYSTNTLGQRNEGLQCSEAVWPSTCISLQESVAARLHRDNTTG